MPVEQTIIDVFEAQAARTPRAIAVSSETEALTYDELNRRANQLGHYLQKMGVGQETLVGVFMERSLEMVVSLYAILKAGGAYVPLDPEYPEERLTFMLEDTQVPVLLVQERLKEKAAQTLTTASTSRPPKIVCVDADWPNIAHERTENPVNSLIASNLAYVIYTSGSTGRPKGVMNEHGGIYNRLIWMQAAYGLTKADRVLQKTPYSFDVSVWEFFWPLMYGARLVVAKPGGHKEPRYLVKLIVDEQITTLHFVPSMLQMFLLDDQVDSCRSLKRVICSGEALPFALQERFFSRLDAELHNLYGPTEAAVDVTYWACQRQSELKTVPIGRPVANTQIHLLDEDLQPVPEGEAGELHIGGVQVARGYLNRPELTREKFIPDPFSPDPNARLYKTGDLARALPDGNILYLGRMDHQVQIHGIRIEVGEIEASLSQHPSVEEVVVVAHEYAPGDLRLVAYVGLKGSIVPGMGAWREFLSRNLPHFMIPSAFVVIDRFPLTHSGKVDRKALPVPEFDRSTLNSPYAPPRNATEERLAAIWATVFKLERVGIEDNFFDLGGDSIISIQLVARAEQAGLRITTQQIFNRGTIAKIATEAKTVAGAQVDQGPVAGPSRLTPIQHWFFQQALPAPEAWNMSLMLAVTEKVQPQLLREALQHLQRHHDVLRSRFEPDDSSRGWRLVVAESAAPPVFRVVDLSKVPEAAQADVVDQTKVQLEAGHDLAQGATMGAAYFHGADSQPDRLFITLHHLVVDDYSWQILVQDLDTAYRALHHGKTPSLPAKTLSFKRWADSLTAAATGERVKAEIAHWTRLADDPVPDLPIDRSDGDNSEASREVITLGLGAADTEHLLNEANRAYNTQPNDLLLTALAEVFCEWAHLPALMIHSEGHGRDDIFEQGSPPARTLGWFTAMFPVKLDLPADDAPGARLKAVKEQLRALPSKGVGYGLLRYLSKAANLHGQLAAMRPPQVLFRFLGQWDKVLPEESVFRVDQAPCHWHGPDNPRPHLLEVSTWVVGGRLRLEVAYSRHRHQPDTIKRLAERYLQALETLIAHCISPDAGGFTPSDFPLADLDDKQLGQLADILDEKD